MTASSGLDLSDVSVDGSQHKAPCGGEGTGKNPCDRAKSGWKWSVATDGANHHDSILFEPTLDSAAHRGLLFDVETLHLDRAYDSKAVRALCEAAGITNVICAKQNDHEAKPTTPSNQPPSVCAGPSNGPTHGSPTTGSSAATPTGVSNTG